MARWLRWSLYGTGALVAVLTTLAVFIVWLLTTTAGARFAGYLAQSQEPRLDVQIVAGDLLSGVEAREVSWRDGATVIAIAELSLRWDALALLERRVDVDLLQVHGVDVRLVSSTTATPLPEPPAQGRREPLELPDIELPVELEIAELIVDRARLELGAGAPQAIKRAELSLNASDTRWQIKRFVLEHADAQVELQGEVNTLADYPVSLSLHAAAAVSGLSERVEVLSRIDGTLSDLQTNHRLSGPVQGELELDVQALDPALPFRLEGRGLAGGWPLDTQRVVRAQEVGLVAEGDLSHLEGRLSAQVSGEQVPAGDWESEFSVAPESQRVKVERLEGALLAGRLQASGEFGWGEALSWQADVALTDIDAAQHWPAAPSQITGPIEVEGAAGAGGWSLDVGLEGLTASLAGKQMRLQGRLGHSQAGSWYLRGLHAAVQGGELMASGELAEKLRLDLHAQFADLSALHEHLEGSLQGSVKLRGPLDSPHIQTRGNGRGISWSKTYSAERLSWEVKVPALGQEPGELELSVDDIQAEDVSISSLALTGFGSRFAHQLNLEVMAPDGQGRVALAGGWLEDRGWRGMVIDAGGEVLGHELELERTLSVHQDGDRFELSPHCWLYKEARLCVEEPLVAGPNAVAADLELANFELAWLEPLLPQELDWQGRLSAAAQVDWGAEDGLRANLEAHGRAGRIALLSVAEGEALPRLERDLRYSSLAVSAAYRQQRAKLRVALDSERAGSMRVALGMDSSGGQDDKPRISGDVSLAGLQAGFFHPFAPQLSKLDGRLDADLQIAGGLQSPQFDGVLELTEGEVELRESPTRLERLNLKLSFDKSRARLDGGVYVGSEQALISGQADWEDLAEWRAQIDLQGQGLEIIYPPYARLRVSPDLSAQIGPEGVELGGSVHLPDGMITVQEVPQQVVSQSDDVVVIRHGEEAGKTDIKADGADDRLGAALQDGETQAWGVDAELEVSFGEELELDAFGVTGGLAGAMRIVQAPESPLAAFGELSIVDGEYRAYGQRLDIRRGLVMFNGPLDRPELDIEALRRIERDQVSAGLRVTGSAREPSVTVFSEPAMSDEDALSYMIRGRPLGAEGPGSDAMLARAALALGIYGAQSTVGGVADKLGVEEFEVEAVGEGDEAQVVVSGYVRPNLYVTYGVGVFQPLNTVTLRYYLTWQLYLEAVSSEESALDLMYRFDIE